MRDCRAYVNAYVENDQLLLLYRNGQGQLRKHVARPEHVSYHLLADFEKAFPRRPLDVLRTSKAVVSYREEGRWVRVCWVDGKTRKAACGEDSPFAARGIRHYEADVGPTRRFVVDHSVQVQRPRRAYFDIETDSRLSFSQKEQMRIVAWSLVYPEGSHVQHFLASDSDDAERELLTLLHDRLEHVDQLLAWNGDGFDFPVLEARTKLLLPERLRHLRRLLLLDHMLLFKRMNLNSAESGDEKQSFALQAIATAVLGEGKDPFDARYTWQAWAAGGAELDEMLRYNLKDTDLLRRIEERTGYVELFQTLCEVCRCFPSSASLRPTAQVDTFMLRLGLENGVHFATRWHDEEAKYERYQGAFVMEPRKGMYHDVHVADFASMYPNIIITWNMSPETKCYAPRGELPPGTCIAPSTGVMFTTTEQGMLPRAVEQLLALRKEWNAKKASLPPGTDEWKEADRRTNAYKVAANSFYGVVGSPFSRYYDREVSESVTQQGAWLIHKTIDQAELRGMLVLAADTDSCFVQGGADEAFVEFVRWCNEEFYPRIVRETGTTNRNTLAYEKKFRLLITVGKKRYCAAWDHYKGKAAATDSKPEVKGLEYKRGDTNVMARRLQIKFVHMLLGADGAEPCADPAAFESLLQAQQDHVLREELPIDEVKLAKTINKDLGDYVVKLKQDGNPAGGPPHVSVAHQMLERRLAPTVRRFRDAGTDPKTGKPLKGRVEYEDLPAGTRVEYVVVDASKSPCVAIPAADYDGTCDRHDLWESMVWPPLKRLLEVAMPDHPWDRWDKTRPKKVRSTRVLPGQLKLL